MLFDWVLRHPARVGVLGAVIGLAAIFFGLHFHIGGRVINGLWAYIGSAISGAAVALLIWYAVGRDGR